MSHKHHHHHRHNHNHSRACCACKEARDKYVEIKEGFWIRKDKIESCSIVESDGEFVLTVNDYEVGKYTKNEYARFAAQTLMNTYHRMNNKSAAAFYRLADLNVGTHIEVAGDFFSLVDNGFPNNNVLEFKELTPELEKKFQNFVDDCIEKIHDAEKAFSELVKAGKAYYEDALAVELLDEDEYADYDEDNPSEEIIAVLRDRSRANSVEKFKDSADRFLYFWRNTTEFVKEL